MPSTSKSSHSSQEKAHGASHDKASHDKAPQEKTHNSHTATTTTDHDEIRKWAEERGAHPACVRGTGGKGDIGMIRLDFPGFSGEDKLEPISWEEFFEEFDKKKLALLHQEETASGQKSNFNKLVSRENAS